MKIICCECGKEVEMDDIPPGADLHTYVCDDCCSRFVDCDEEFHIFSELKCPLGGDETNDCEDCCYSDNYHFVDGECVARE